MFSGVGSKPWRERPRIVKLVLLVVEEWEVSREERESRKVW